MEAVSNNKIKRVFAIFFIIFFFNIMMSSGFVFAEDGVIIPSLELNFGQEAGNTATSIQILVLITILSLAPSILVMMTSFTRFIIVFSFLRKAISLQSTPPNQVLIALSLFMTFFVMAPVFETIVEDAYQPYVNQEISQAEALENASIPIKKFMLSQVRAKDLALFTSVNGVEDNIVESEDKSLDEVDKYLEVPITTIIPAFLISEIKTGFQIGFLLFIPFIVIDMVVASTLMALGMMMLPPVMISLPFKILLFIMADGWNLLVEQLLRTVR